MTKSRGGVFGVLRQMPSLCNESWFLAKTVKLVLHDAKFLGQVAGTL